MYLYINIKYTYMYISFFPCLAEQESQGTDMPVAYYFFIQRNSLKVIFVKENICCCCGSYCAFSVCVGDRSSQNLSRTNLSLPVMSLYRLPCYLLFSTYMFSKNLVKQYRMHTPRAFVSQIILWHLHYNYENLKALLIPLLD